MAGVSREFRCLRAAVAAAMLLAGSFAVSQISATADIPPQTVEDALHQMSDQAAVIFAGRVMAVRRQTGAGDTSGFVEVEFRVDQAVRGCTANTPYVLHEWAGLWAGDARRYRVGERLLMFLHAPSASGLSSPVDGLDGEVPIHGGSSALVANGATAQYPVADLRWIGTQVLRPVSYRARSAHYDHRQETRVPFVSAQPMMRAVAAGPENADVVVTPDSVKRDETGASIPAQHAAVPALIGMLRSWEWEKANDAAR